MGFFVQDVARQRKQASNYLEIAASTRMNRLFSAPAFRKSIAALGWLLLLCFLFLGVAGSVGRGSVIGNILGWLFFGGLSAMWLRLGWKTLRDWFSATTATSLLALLLLLYAGGVYVAWLGRN
jgi:hypothetical protein